MVGGVAYNAANQVLSGVDNRSYNANGQLTEIRAGSYRYKYNYSPTQNNGRITSMQDVASGETITYASDSLNRLISASGAGRPARELEPSVLLRRLRKFIVQDRQQRPECDQLQRQSGDQSDYE
jgi:hypothetical protein